MLIWGKVIIRMGGCTLRNTQIGLKHGGEKQGESESGEGQVMRTETQLSNGDSLH